MPRFRLNPFVAKRDSSDSPTNEDFNPQAEWERKHKKENEEDNVSRSTMDSQLFPEESGQNMSVTHQQEVTAPLLSEFRDSGTNNCNSGSFDPPEESDTRTSSPTSGRVSPKSNLVEMHGGDSGYVETERASQITDSLTSAKPKIQPQTAPMNREAYQVYRVEPPYGSAPNALTTVRSNSSRLDTLAHSKARLLVLNEDLTIRSLENEDNIAEILGMSDTAVKGITVENLLQNFGRLPMDRIHHFAMVGEYVRSLHVENKMVDVLIHVAGQTFGAHRVALACHSKYFADIFMHHDEKTKLPVELTLTGMGPLAFQAFLRYVYTGEMIVSPESVGDVLAVSEKLSTPEIKDICSEYIDTIPVDQSMAIIASKHTNRSSYIFKHAYNLVVDNFCEVFDVDHFLKLSLDLVCLLLSDDNLYVTTEMDVFWAGLKWVAYHITERHNYVSRVMKCIRFSLLSKRELFQCFEVTDLLRKSPACREMLFSALWIITAAEMGRPDPLNLPKAQPRLCMRENYVPKSHENFKSFYEDDIGVPEDEGRRLLPVEDSHTPGTNFPRPSSPETVSSVADSNFADASGLGKTGDILAIGGFHRIEKDKDELKDVERYSTTENQWKYYTGLPEPRQQHAVAMLGGKLYLVGGADPKKSKKNPVANNTAFKFDPAKGSWSKIGALKTPRMSHALCPLYGMLYAIGGQDDKNRVLKSVECFNPLSNTWHHVKELITARYGFGACVCNGRIYVAGGYAAAADKRSKMPVITNFECYDPKFNTWSDLRPLRMGRCLCNLVAIGNAIYLCGGATRPTIKDEIQSLASIDVYNVDANTWRYRTDLIKPRHNAGATVIGTKIYLIGGTCSLDNQTLQSIECYDTRTECWDTSIQDLPYPAKWLGCVALPAK